MFPKQCKYPSCSNLTHDTYCEEHVGYQTKPSRASAARRGYNSRWQRYRESFLMNNPLCVECGRIATVVDHIKAHKGSYALFWDTDNHQAMCESCHNRKTATEDMQYWDTSKGLQ